MRRWILPLLLLVSHALSASAAEVVRVAPWELHSSFWMSLHQSLIADAMQLAPRDLTKLAADDRTAWEAAVAAYRAAAPGNGDMTFADPMVITNDALSQVADDSSEPLIDGPLAKELLRAAPVYRKQWWTADDAANRFFIGYAAAMLREAGADLVRQHECVYRTPWPQRISVYITPAAGPFGAYTMKGRAGGVITTMSSRDAGYQGFRALEMLLHESSHAVVGPRNGTVAAALAAAAKQHGVAVPRDLWHALLFTTSGELTRRLLAARGVAAYVPSSDDLFARAWPKYRAPLEAHWLPYLDGTGTLEEAVEKIVVAMAAKP